MRRSPAPRRSAITAKGRVTTRETVGARDAAAIVEIDALARLPTGAADPTVITAMRTAGRRAVIATAAVGTTGDARPLSADTVGAAVVLPRETAETGLGQGRPTSVAETADRQDATLEVSKLWLINFVCV